MNNRKITTLELLEKLDGSDYWRHESGMVFNCNGHSVNVYQVNPDGSSWNEIDFFTVGSFKYDTAELKDYKSGIESYLKQLQEVEL